MVSGGATLLLCPILECVRDVEATGFHGYACHSSAPVRSDMRGMYVVRAGGGGGGGGCSCPSTPKEADCRGCFTSSSSMVVVAVVVETASAGRIQQVAAAAVVLQRVIANANYEPSVCSCCWPAVRLREAGDPHVSVTTTPRRWL